jgi:flagellin
MTRINTNVSSLVAQNTLGRSNSALEQALTRLSTGLRINTGKDDPAGLIASENLRSDITSIKRAIGNTDRANQVIATADSSLGQVSSLLNDIRGLITESANTGVLSDEQITANQSQIDSSLDALNRIAQTTSFQGRRLLDGSLDFNITQGTGFSTVAGLKIDQANLGATGSLAVAVDITAAATQAELTNTTIAASVAGAAATADVTFTDAITTSAGTIDIDLLARQSTGTLTFDTTVAEDIVITALAGGNAAGAVGGAFGGINVVINENAGTAGGVNSAVYSAVTNEITIEANLASGTVTDTEIATAIAGINGGLDFSVSGNSGNNLAAADIGTYTNVATGGRNASTESISATGVAGAAGNATFSFVEANLAGAGTAVVANGGGSYTIQIDNSIGSVTIAAIAAAIQTTAEIATATTASTASYFATGDVPPSGAQAVSGGADAADDVITVQADIEGTAANGVTVTIQEAATGSATPTAAIDSFGDIVVTVDNTLTTTIANIALAINGLAGYSATVTQSDGDGNYIGASNAPPALATLASGVAATGGLDDDLVIEISGATGSELLQFNANSSVDLIADAINAASDATGVTAANSSGNLVLSSIAYGTNAFVDVKVVEEDDNDTFKDGFGGPLRGYGTDVVAAVNGIQANGDGNTLSINTSGLDLSLTVTDGSSTDVNFTIDGGGALFQLGPDVVSNQQARIGITSVNTARLGGVSGKLYQLSRGGTADLSSDTTTAASIVEEAINQVASLRGRLGSFQRTILETNKNALNDTLVNLTAAESQIRDADFAAETAALTRAQILVQSGTTVLAISNQNPQNVLALLR